MSYIEIKGARANNLQNIDVSIPRNQLVVITGLSGSGKSSLAFDTLYAEGQRRYVESLSSYARQFMGKLSKPEVEYIKGIPPAIAIEQRVISRNPRSTVGTTTEIYEYLKLLFARIGKTFSPVNGEEVKREDIQDVIHYIEKAPAKSRIYILAPFKIVPDRTLLQQLEILKMQGFSRMMLNKKLCEIDELLTKGKFAKSDNLQLLIDRFKSENIQDQKMRIADSIQTAFQEGKGEAVVQVENGKVTQRHFSNLFEIDGIAFEEPTPLFFSFNNPYGACPVCGGTGHVDGVSPELTIPDRSKSLFNDAVVCWRGEKLQNFKHYFIKHSEKYNFPIHRPIAELTEEQYDLLWNGNAEVIGILRFFKMLEEEGYKVQNRVLIARYRGRTLCPECKGTRVRKDANYVKIQGKSISDLVQMPIEELHDFFANFRYHSEYEKQVAKQLVSELKNRLHFLLDVGLGYLTLNRLSKTLSGGESQRINLATSLGSSLVGSLYILDEPSIGLHPRDTQNLIRVLKRLRDIGNTVVIVEHDEEIIRNADYIIDIGPKAGRLGGKVVFTGTFDKLLKAPDNLTAAYIRGMEGETKNTLSIPLPKHRRKWRNYVEVKNATTHNLKNLTVKLPLDIFTVVTGVSGSGKSTLIKEVLYPLLQKKMQYIAGQELNDVSNLHLSKETISEVILVDQNPIGRSSRSNPATYIKVYDDIRELYAQQPLAKQRNYKPGFFSFNVPGGRCETCEGEGVIHVEMQFMADVDLVCTDCNGSRFKDEALDVKINNISVADILQMTIDQAREFFEALPVSKIVTNIINKLAPMQEVGLGYLKMGQSSSTLSGGEAQRVKLAFYLCHGNAQKNHLFIFDEPTTGLHFHDINSLYHSFNKLIEIGHSIIVIEHNPELIKCADWVIDLGPEGGDKGGYLVFEGTPEELVKCEDSYTGKFLKGKV
ncbi:MAG: excinuclease ABC subunit UvrA [Bacteroidetes bacterium]|nr:excinuclease ABC subunit UvrA [Bacteroidota bacterium]MCL2303303.1 excinuclease ABC subunit UvrA [Lentimicrobiaceae bacterium]